QVDRAAAIPDGSRRWHAAIRVPRPAWEAHLQGVDARQRGDREGDAGIGCACLRPRVRPSRARPAGCAGRGRTARRTWQPMRGLIRFPTVNAATERRERRATDTSPREDHRGWSSPDTLPDAPRFAFYLAHEREHRTWR